MATSKTFPSGAISIYDVYYTFSWAYYSWFGTPELASSVFIDGLPYTNLDMNGSRYQYLTRLVQLPAYSQDGNLPGSYPNTQISLNQYRGRTVYYEGAYCDKTVCYDDYFYMV